MDLIQFNFNIENYGMRRTYDQKDTPHADMCFRNLSVFQSVY